MTDPKMVSPLERFRADDRSALFDGVSGIGFKAAQGIALAGGPGDFHALSLSGFPQTKSQGEFALRAGSRQSPRSSPKGNKIISRR